MDQTEIKYFIEAALLAAGRPLSADQLQSLFDGRSAPSKPDIRAAIDALVSEIKAAGANALPVFTTSLKETSESANEEFTHHASRITYHVIQTETTL